MQLRTQHKEPAKVGPLLVLFLSVFGLAYGGYYRSTMLEHAIVGAPNLGDLVQRDKAREQMLLEEHQKYRSYETHNDIDRAGLIAIITGASDE